jgi:hypothetical protein
LAGGLGAILPGNYLPHTYTDDLPSVRMLEMLREAEQRLMTFAGHATATFTLGKI